MQNFKLIVRYDGTAFQGWQTQPGFRTVQETVEGAIMAITREQRIRANCSGRTDAGVHAVGQVCNFYSQTTLEPVTLLKAINAKLPEDVAVTSCELVGQSFCANKDAKRKLYRYVVNDSRIPDPFLRRYSWQPERGLNAAIMHEAGQCLKGRHDFRCFETNWPNRMTSIRTITHFAVSRMGDCVWVDVEADGFLYNMVRAIVGTLYQVGRGYWPPESVAKVLIAQDRRDAGPTAPPQGLFMIRVTY